MLLLQHIALLAFDSAVATDASKNKLCDEHLDGSLVPVVALAALRSGVSTCSAITVASRCLVAACSCSVSSLRVATRGCSISGLGIASRCGAVSCLCVTTSRCTIAGLRVAAGGSSAWAACRNGLPID